MNAALAGGSVMADGTKIEWADATFNPWRGCTKVSPACDHCYAEELARRYGWAKWGNHPRERQAESSWAQPLTWNRQADAFEAEHGRPRMVFCASLADVFDNQVPEEWRRDLFDLIRKCDRLIWLLLTKRPQNMAKMLPADWGQGWPHVWLGATVENQAEADRRIPALLSVPAARRFLSCEPLLGPVDLMAIRRPKCDGGSFMRPLDGRFNRIDWVIAGGESGKHARPSHPDWFRSLRDQCAAADVPFFFKQWGEWIGGEVYSRPGHGGVLHGGFARHQDLEQSEFGGRVTHWFSGDAFEGLIASRVGKLNAGRLLDGVAHDGRPAA